MKLFATMNCYAPERIDEIIEMLGEQRERGFVRCFRLSRFVPDSPNMEYGNLIELRDGSLFDGESQITEKDLPDLICIVYE